MEAIAIIIFFLFGGTIISFVWKALSGGGKAVVDTARGQGTLGENLSANFKGVPETAFRVVDDVITLDDGNTLDVFKFEMSVFSIRSTFSLMDLFAISKIGWVERKFFSNAIDLYIAIIADFDAE